MVLGSMANSLQLSAWREKEYWIFCDESVQEGSKFSNCFGGVIVPAARYPGVENRLRIAKAEIGFLKELKWQRVTEQWRQGYERMITSFFDVIRTGDVRMRVMFRASDIRETQSRAQRDESYFKLYYQFIKHAFGLAQVPDRRDGTRLRLFFDQFPHTKEKVTQFKGFLGALPDAAAVRHAKLQLSPDHVTEVDSKEHVLLQCVDVVLGAMAFRLNDMHLVKPEGKRSRGKRTVAKDRLYRHTLAEICTLKPAFNPKISTATEPYPEGRWSMPYRHWLFVPQTFPE
ncbi:MAG: hypothetical protein QOH24_632 [Verrucomicrobiota bacterium]|jgi:hypothetical protein